MYADYERREQAEERALKPLNFPKWLGDAGVISFLDFLLAEEVDRVTPQN